MTVVSAEPRNKKCTCRLCICCQNVLSLHYSRRITFADDSLALFSYSTSELLQQALLVHRGHGGKL